MSRSVRRPTPRRPTSPARPASWPNSPTSSTPNWPRSTRAGASIRPPPARVATQMMAHDALGAHARDELGISEATTARPLQAAMASALTFTAGAAAPLAVVPLVPMGIVIPARGSRLVAVPRRSRRPRRESRRRAARSLDGAGELLGRAGDGCNGRGGAAVRRDGRLTFSAASAGRGRARPRRRGGGGPCGRRRYRTPCGPAASQSRTLARIAPRRSARSAAATGRGLPVITSTSRAPIALACSNPSSSRRCAPSSVWPWRSSVKSGSSVPRASFLSQVESSGCRRIARRRCCQGDRARQAGRGPWADGARAPQAPPPARVGEPLAAHSCRGGSSGCTVAATRAQAAASSAVSPRGGFTCRSSR